MIKKNRIGDGRLYWLTNHYTYYNDYLFHHIRSDGTFNLIVCYRDLILETHPWKEVNDSEYAVLKMNKFPLGLDLRLIGKAIWSNDDFIIAGWDNIMYLIMITILRLRNVPFGIFSDTPNQRGKGLKQTIKRHWLQYVFNRNSKARLLVTGNVGVSRACEYLQLLPDKVLNFPFTTNHELFCPSDHGVQNIKQGSVIFLAVGRIDFNHKGQDVALHAFAKLLKQGKNRFRYRVAGIGEDFNKLQELVFQLGLEDYVEYLGWVEIRELPRLFNDSHFTLHTSHEDPYPNSVLESLSCGIPVISSNAAGSALDRIESGVNGFLYTDGELVELENLLSVALDMTEIQWKEMKEKSRSMALEWPAVYNLGIIHKLFSRSSV